MAINQRRKISRVAYLVFTKKYGLHLHSDATRYLEELLQDEENLTETLEKIVKAYKRRFAGSDSPEGCCTTWLNTVPAVRSKYGYCQ